MVDLDTAQRKLEEGMLREQDGQLDEAMKCYDEAIALQPDLARAHFESPRILRRLQPLRKWSHEKVNQIFP